MNCKDVKARLTSLLAVTETGIVLNDEVRTVCLQAGRSSDHCFSSDGRLLLARPDKRVCPLVL